MVPDMWLMPLRNRGSAAQEYSITVKDKIITLTIECSLGSFQKDFDHTTKVADAAKEAALQKGYPDGTYWFVFNGELLKPERTLESYHLQDGNVVTLTAAGDTY